MIHSDDCDVLRPFFVGMLDFIKNSFPPSASLSSLPPSFLQFSLSLIICLRILVPVVCCSVSTRMCIVVFAFVFYFCLFTLFFLFISLSAFDTSMLTGEHQSAFDHWRRHGRQYPSSPPISSTRVQDIRNPESEMNKVGDMLYPVQRVSTPVSATEPSGLDATQWSVHIH